MTWDIATLEQRLAAVRRAVALHHEGRSLRQIATTLDEEGYPAPRSRWNYQSVYRLLAESGASVTKE